MADIKLVIKIPEKWFYDMVREEFKDVDELCAVIQHGTLLPTEHGRLIDADALYREIETEGWFDSDDEYYGGGLEDIVLNAPTIIEADKGE